MPAAEPSALADRADPAALAPAGSALTNDKGDILYISGHTGKYLEPAVGKANLNVFAMAREGLRYELSSAFSAALRRKEPVTIKGLKVRSNGIAQTIDLTVRPVAEPKALRGTMMVVFSEVAAAPAGPRSAKAVKSRRRLSGSPSWSGSCSMPTRRSRPPARRCRPRRKS